MISERGKNKEARYEPQTRIECADVLTTVWPSSSDYVIRLHTFRQMESIC